MCNFCKNLKFTKKMNRPKCEMDRKIRYKYSVALVTRLFVKGIRGYSGRNVDYRNLGCGYELNYCPECGKPLKRGIKAYLESEEG